MLFFWEAACDRSAFDRTEHSTGNLKIADMVFYKPKSMNSWWRNHNSPANFIALRRFSFFFSDYENVNKRDLAADK